MIHLCCALLGCCLFLIAPHFLKELELAGPVTPGPYTNATPLLEAQDIPFITGGQREEFTAPLLPQATIADPWAALNQVAASVQGFPSVVITPFGMLGVALPDKRDYAYALRPDGTEDR